MAHKTRQKPWGFRDFVKMHGYCSVYLLDVGTASPIKVGMTDNPERRLVDFQIAHFRLLKFHSVWWLPGKAIAARLENAFKYDINRHAPLRPDRSYLDALRLLLASGPRANTIC